LIRVLMIGTFSATGGRLFSHEEKQLSNDVQYPLRKNTLPSQPAAANVSIRTTSPQRPLSQPQPHYKPVSAGVVSQFKPPVAG
jgi:hypothetical protein